MKEVFIGSSSNNPEGLCGCSCICMCDCEGMELQWAFEAPGVAGAFALGVFESRC